MTAKKGSAEWQKRKTRAVKWDAEAKALRALLKSDDREAIVDYLAEHHAKNRESAELMASLLWGQNRDNASGPRKGSAPWLLLQLGAPTLADVDKKDPGFVDRVYGGDRPAVSSALYKLRRRNLL